MLIFHVPTLAAAGESRMKLFPGIERNSLTYERTLTRSNYITLTYPIQALF